MSHKHVKRGATPRPAIFQTTIGRDGLADLPSLTNSVAWFDSRAAYQFSVNSGREQLAVTIWSICRVLYTRWPGSIPGRPTNSSLEGFVTGRDGLVDLSSLIRSTAWFDSRTANHA